MRRLHAILVILALLATPMALLARSDCDQSACDCMCSLVYRSLSTRAKRRPMLCGQASTSLHRCAMNAKHHRPDYGLNTLMAPTAPHPLVALLVPAAAAPSYGSMVFPTPSGHPPVPFQPPRS